MKLIEFLEGFRTETVIKIRIDNYAVCEVNTEKNYCLALNEKLLNSEVNDYFVDSKYNSIGYMVVDVKGERE